MEENLEQKRKIDVLENAHRNKEYWSNLFLIKA